MGKNSAADSPVPSPGNLTSAKSAYSSYTFPDICYMWGDRGQSNCNVYFNKRYFEKTKMLICPDFKGVKRCRFFLRPLLDCFYPTRLGKREHLHQIADDVKSPTKYFKLQVTLFYMSTGSFSRGNENLCQLGKSAKRTQRAPGADKTALSIKVA